MSGIVWHEERPSFSDGLGQLSHFYVDRAGKVSVSVSPGGGSFAEFLRKARLRQAVEARLPELCAAGALETAEALLDEWHGTGDELVETALAL